MLTAGDLEVVNAALIAIGERPLTGDDGSAEYLAARAAWWVEVPALLALHPWAFATTQVVLAELIAPPVAGAGHAFALPADALRPISVTDQDGRAMPYRVRARLIETADPGPLVLTYVAAVGPETWSAGFRAAVVDFLAARLAAGLADAPGNKVEALRANGELALRRARLADAQAETPAVLGAAGVGDGPAWPLIAARG